MNRRDFPRDRSIERRLAQRFRVTLALTVVPLVIGSIILSLFTGFGRPDVGAIVIGVLFAPVVIGAWVEYGLMRSRLSNSLRASKTIDRNDAPPV
jgi:hypothetical protein